MSDMMTAYRALADTLSDMVEADAVTISDEFPNGREALADLLATIAGLDPEPTPGTKRPVHTWNPQKWQDPDEVGSSEYRVMHELATDVWESNSGINNTDRAQMVEESVRELGNIVTSALVNGGCN